jgi:hypothetical protein
MAYDDQKNKRSKVILEDDAASRDFSQSEGDYARRGNFSASKVVAVLVVLAGVIVAVLALLFWSMRANSRRSSLPVRPPATAQVAVRRRPPGTL